MAGLESDNHPNDQSEWDRPFHLGPVGRRVEVDFTIHGILRLRVRLRTMFAGSGLTVDKLVDLIRHPNAEKRDEWDPDNPNEKFRRWFLLPNGQLVRCILVILEPTTKAHPGRVGFVTLFERKASNP